MASTELIIFDLYGTLVQFGIKNHPYRKIMKWAHELGRAPKPQDARSLLTLDYEPADAFSAIGIEVPTFMLSQLQAEIEEEIQGITLFDDVIPVLTQLTSSGIPMVICSNLAKPYGCVINTLLPDFKFIKCLSYEVGYIKPEKAIYEWITSRSSFTPEQCLFVGDTLLADYEGPRQHGFQARHLIREGNSSNETIKNLTEILSLF